jgi:pseudouridine synthase
MSVKAKRNDSSAKGPTPPEAEIEAQPLRLQRILALAGVASRRKAEEWIRQGRVRVDGEVITDLGVKFLPSAHRITVDGRPLPPLEGKVYYLFNKPKGVLSTLRDPQGRPTVRDYLFRAGIRERLFPVGRLDWDAEGLMLLTNDGVLAQRLQHPRFQVPKTYRVKVRGVPSDETLNNLRTGIRLPSGKIHRADWERVKNGEDRAWLLITVREGEKHQVKHMLAALGHPVLTLKRVALGPLSLGRLPSGALRPLTDEEIRSLKTNLLSRLPSAT